MPSIADSIPSEECFTLKEVADELGVGAQQAVKLIDKALRENLTQRLIKKEGMKNLYAPQMVEQLIAARREGKLGKIRQTLIVSKNAKLTIPVYIFDEELAEILNNQFDSINSMSKYLQNYLENDTKTIKAELQKIRQEAEYQTKQLLKSKKLFNTQKLSAG